MFFYSVCRGIKSIVSRDTIAKQAIRYFLSVADIMHDKVPLAIVVSLFYYDSDMCNSFPKIPGYYVARFIIIRIRRGFQRSPVPGEKCSEVWNSAVIYILIRSLQTPIFWINAKIPHHILMNILLQIYAHFSVGSDNYIGTHAFVCRYISIWIRYNKV